MCTPDEHVCLDGPDSQTESIQTLSADVHSLLADIGMEQENFESALQDHRRALQLLDGILKVCLACSWCACCTCARHDGNSSTCSMCNSVHVSSNPHNPVSMTSGCPYRAAGCTALTVGMV